MQPEVVLAVLEIRPEVVLAVLERTLQLIEQGWTQGADARNEWHRPVPEGSLSACEYCLRGAISRAALDLRLDPASDYRLTGSPPEVAWKEVCGADVALVELLEKSVTKPGEPQVRLVAWNDSPFRTKLEVVAALRCLELLQSGWIQGHYAADADGRACEIDNVSACQFCADGAIVRAAYECGVSVHIEDYVRREWLRQLRRDVKPYLIGWNDDPARELDDVLAMGRRVFEALRAQEMWDDE